MVLFFKILRMGLTRVNVRIFLTANNPNYPNVLKIASKFLVKKNPAQSFAKQDF